MRDRGSPRESRGVLAAGGLEHAGVEEVELRWATTRRLARRVKTGTRTAIKRSSRMLNSPPPPRPRPRSPGPRRPCSGLPLARSSPPPGIARTPHVPSKPLLLDLLAQVGGDVAVQVVARVGLRAGKGETMLHRPPQVEVLPQLVAVNGCMKRVSRGPASRLTPVGAASVRWTRSTRTAIGEYSMSLWTSFRRSGTCWISSRTTQPRWGPNGTRSSQPSAAPPTAACRWCALQKVEVEGVREAIARLQAVFPTPRGPNRKKDCLDRGGWSVLGYTSRVYHAITTYASL